MSLHFKQKNMSVQSKTTIAPSYTSFSVFNLKTLFLKNNSANSFSYKIQQAANYKN